MTTPSSRIYRVCAQCFKVFSVKPSVVKDGGGIFCSQKCHYMKSSHGVVPRVCAHCFKNFDVSVRRLKEGRGGVFCSRSCYFADRVSNALPNETRFWKHVNKTDGCWLWMGANCKGYGVIGNRKNLCYAHRLSWEIHNGIIPAGLLVLHHCDTPACV